MEPTTEGLESISDIFAKLTQRFSNQDERIQSLEAEKEDLGQKIAIKKQFLASVKAAITTYKSRLQELDRGLHLKSQPLPVMGNTEDTLMEVTPSQQSVHTERSHTDSKKIKYPETDGLSTKMKENDHNLDSDQAAKIAESTVTHISVIVPETSLENNCDTSHTLICGETKFELEILQIILSATSTFLVIQLKNGDFHLFQLTDCSSFKNVTVFKAAGIVFGFFTTIRNKEYFVVSGETTFLWDCHEKKDSDANDLKALKTSALEMEFPTIPIVSRGKMQFSEHHSSLIFWTKTTVCVLVDGEFRKLRIQTKSITINSGVKDILISSNNNMAVLRDDKENYFTILAQPKAEVLIAKLDNDIGLIGMGFVCSTFGTNKRPITLQIRAYAKLATVQASEKIIDVSDVFEDIKSFEIKDFWFSTEGGLVAFLVEDTGSRTKKQVVRVVSVDHNVACHTVGDVSNPDPHCKLLQVSKAKENIFVMFSVGDIFYLEKLIQTKQD